MAAQVRGKYIRLDAMMMSDESCVLSLLVRASVLALSCLILDHRLWPDDAMGVVEKGLMGLCMCLRPRPHAVHASPRRC